MDLPRWLSSWWAVITPTSPKPSAFVIPLYIRIRRLAGSYPRLVSISTNAVLSPDEQPGADDTKDGGDEEPCAPLGAAPASGERGDEEDHRQGEKDVFG